VPTQYADEARERGLISHNGSAMWIFDLNAVYRPGAGIVKGSYLLRYELSEVAETNIKTIEHIDFESTDFEGESKHPRKIIYKANEVGAYGLGTLRQGITNMHVRTRYASLRETASALNCKEREVDVAKYRPRGGWG